MITIYHNNTCSKSQCALAVLQQSGNEFTVVNYLETPPAAGELSAIIKKLGVTAHDIIRKSEAVYIEKYEGRQLTEEEWIAAMVEHPVLIERPIVVSGDRAVIARPAENVYRII